MMTNTIELLTNRIMLQVGASEATVIHSFFTLVTGPRRSLRLKLSDKRVYEP